MIMMKNIWFISLCAIILFHACIDDDSTLPVKAISEISIQAPSDTINLDFGFELVYEPEIEQTMEDMELSYEWSYHGYTKTSIGGIVKDSLKFLSNERVLRYAFKKLGEYQLRLKVTNEHGSTFKYFTLFVKAAFDQGIFVLSSDEDKKGRVSFMRPLSREEIEAGKEESFYTSAFVSVNPGYALNDPTDAEKIGPDIFIASRGDKLIYRMNAQTFELYNVTDFKTDFPWVKPIGICSKDRSITNYVVLSEDGGFATVNYKSDIAIYEGEFFEGNPKMDKMYVKITGAPIPPSTSVSRMRSYHFFLNYERSTLYYFYDELQLSPEVITILLEYCVSNGKKNMNYIEKVAISWNKNGIFTIDAADKFITAEKEKNGYSYKIRKLFGIENRNLSKTEETYLKTWHDKFLMNEDMVELAYEYCIMQTTKLSFPYINSILKRWHELNIHNVADAKKDHEDFKTKNKSQKDLSVYDDNNINYDELEEIMRDKM